MKEIVDRACAKGSKVLILAHRNLLLHQHKQLIKNCRIESVFTEVNHLGEHDNPDLIIIDEAHISGANSYQRVCEYYHCKRILFTATAKRLDNKPLNLCDEIINGISGDELIDRGDIAPYDLYAPKLDIDINNVSMSGSDFNNDELANVMMDKKVYGDIIKYYRQLAGDKQAIAYCTNIKHSRSICELFNSNGIPAVHIDAKTSENERLEAMKAFEQGKYRILCNCNLISEGITMPYADCVMLLRPTQSETLYIQQSCRCLTPREGKRSIIIDFVGNVFTHGMPTEKRIYTLKRQRIRNSSREPDLIVRECKKCHRVYKGVNPICPYCGFNNGKTRKQIKQEKEAELVKIQKVKRMQVGMARTFEQLVRIGIERGYKNPAAWAHYIISARKKI